MKKFFKWVFIVVVGFIALGVIMAALGDDTATKKDESKTVAQPVSKPVKSEPKKEKKASSSITKANYDKIKQGDAVSGKGGMSRAEVEKMFGKPESVTNSETTVGNQTVKMDTATWMTKDLEIVTVVYTNGNVSSKMWAGGN